MDMPRDHAWTYDDLARLPDDGTRYEIIEGELVVMPSPLLIHQRVLGRLFLAFQAQVEATHRGFVVMTPLDVILAPTRVVQPDLVALRVEHRDLMKPHGIEGAPDLLLEVLPPSSAKHDRVTKRRLYARAGVREYWLVDPDAQTIDVLELVDDGLSYRQHGWYGPGDRARSAQLELEIEVDALFRGLEPPA